MNISEWNQQQTTIGHLKVRYAGSQEDTSKTVLRLRMERLLTNADLHPPGLGTGAILIVRKLEGTAPVDVSTQSQPVHAGWHELLRSQVTALYASAVRPAFEAIPLDATSVLFADPGEMLTCLTRDLLSGQAHERWYWQQVLRNVPRTPGVALPALWSEQATFVPGVLASLRPAEMFGVITHLTPLAVKQVIHSLHKSFDLPSGVFTALASGSAEASPSTRVMRGDLPAVKEPVASSAHAASLPPWEQWLPSDLLPALWPEARYLLGLGLALYHAPAFARSTRFAGQAVQWLQGQQGLEGQQAAREKQIYESGGSRHLKKNSGEEIALPELDDAQLMPLAHEGEQRRSQVEDTTARDMTHRQAMSPVGEEQSPVASTRSNEDVPPAAKQEPSSTEPGERSGERVSAESHEPAVSREREPVQQESRGLEAGASLPSVHSGPHETKTWEFEFGGSKALSTDGVATGLAGVLYLINLLTWLNLPHSWDDDGKFAQVMSGWAIVEVLARGLLGELYEQYRDDPIWEALALLDRREPGQLIAANGMGLKDCQPSNEGWEPGDRKGRYTCPPDRMLHFTHQIYIDEPLEEERVFRLPASWLRRFGVVVWSAFQSDERLLLYDDEAGFLVAGVPLRGRTFFEAAHAEVKAYSDAGVEVSWHIGSKGGQHEIFPPFPKRFVENALGEEALWWLEQVMGFVYCVLERALGESFDDATRLAELVLCRHGQLVVSRTHVDLYMSMEEISIAVRRAGLDRDPGWVPDLRRIVYFHFD